MIDKTLEYEEITVYFTRVKINNDIAVFTYKRSWMDAYVVVAAVKLNGRKLKFNRKRSADMYEFILE